MLELSREQVITLSAIFTAAFLVLIGIFGVVFYFFPPEPLDSVPVVEVQTQ